MANEDFLLAELQTTPTLDGSDLLYVSQGGASKAVAFEDMIKSVVVGENQQLFFNNDGEMGACQNVKYSPKGNILTIQSRSSSDVPIVVKNNIGTTVATIDSSGNITSMSGVFRFVNSNYFIANLGPGSDVLQFGPTAGTSAMSLTAGALYITNIRSYGNSGAISMTVNPQERGGNAYEGISLTMSGGIGSTAVGSYLGGRIVVVGGAAGGNNNSGGVAYVCGGPKHGSGADGDVALCHDGTTARGNLRVCRGVTTGLTTTGTVIGKWEIFNESGVSIGFIPIYDSVT